MKRLFITILLGFTTSAQALTLTARDVMLRTRMSTPAGRSLKLNVESSRQDIAIASSQYDTTATALASYSQDKTERSSTIFGTSTTQTKFEAELGQLTPFGTQIKVGFTNARDSSNSAFFNPGTYFDSRLAGVILQPLAKNAFGFATRKNIQLARTALSATKEDTTAKMNELGYQNLFLYWNWYWLSHVINIHEQALMLAERLYRTNVEKLKLGLIESPDLNAFAANVNMKQSNLISLETELTQVEQLLRASLDLTDTPHLVVGSEKFTDGGGDSCNNLLQEALLHHPALEALKQELKTQDIKIALQKNARLPQVDLVASLASNGLDPDYPTAVSDISDFNPAWSTGVSLSFPLQNRLARHGLQKLDILKRQKLYQFKQTENQITAQIRLTHQRYQNAFKNLKITADAVFNQNRKWDGEVRRFEQGRSDPDLVIRYQDDYLNARMAHLKSKVETALARLELDRARGVLGE